MLTDVVSPTAPSQSQRLDRHRSAVVYHDAETALEHRVEFCRYWYRHFGAHYDDNDSNDWTVWDWDWNWGG